MTRAAPATAFFCALLLAVSAARAATPVPPYPTDHVAVAEVPDDFDPLRTFLADFESQVGARYDVAVVAYSDRLSRRGPEYGDVDGAYIDSVVAAWLPQVDAETCVLIVLAVQNRDIIVHPCSRWAALGFEAAEIVRVIDGSPFGPNARAGNYSRALTELVRSIDRHLGQRVADRAASLRQAAQEIADARGALEQVAAELSQREPLEAVQEHLSQVPAELVAAERALAEERLPEVHERLRQARQRLVDAEQAQRDHENAAFRRSVLAWGAAGVGILLMVAVLLLRLWRLRHERRRTQREVASWDTLLSRAGERLLALENEHALLLGRRDLVDHFQAATKDPILAVARRVDELFMSFERAQQVVAEAKAVMAQGSFFNLAPIRAAAAQLTTAEIVARTEDVKERRLYLPHQREVRMPARDLLAHLETSYEAAVAEVDELEGRITDSWDGLDRLAERTRQAEACQTELVELGVDPEAYSAVLEPLAGHVHAIRERGATDPLGVVDETSALAAELDALVSRCDRAVEAAGWLVRQVRLERERLLAEVARLRADEGLILNEPGFEPDAMLERARALEEKGLREAEQGHDEEAHAAASDAVAIVEELPELIAATQVSRSDSPDEVKAAGERSQLLRAKHPERHARIQALRDIHADAALQPALDNAEEAQAALDFADRCVAEAQTALKPKEQRYLAAAELMRRAAEALDQVDALYAEIDQKSDQLDELKRACQVDLAAAEGILGDVRKGLEGDPPFASNAVLSARSDAQKLLADVRAAADAAQPNWVAAARGAATLLALARETRQRMERDREAFGRASALRPELDALRAGIDALLRGSSEDRRHANERFEQANALLKELGPHVSAERPEWVEIVPILAHAQSLLTESKQLAEADFTAAAAARQAISQAEAAHRQADRSYGHGVRPQLDQSRDLLQDARTRLARQDYEAAAQGAGQARLKAIQAERDAVASAARIADQERRWASSSWSGGSGGGGYRSSSSGSSRSSFSFGGGSSRSSGRSSFGSSSGRSSFGRSSGRSKF